MPNLFDRLAALAVALTALLMFSAIGFITPRISSWGLPASIAAYLVGGLASIAIYRITAKILFWGFKKLLFLRKLILGRAFLEGTWVGKQTSNGRIRSTIEVIDQRSGMTIIFGRAVDDDGITTETWHSTSSTIDLEHMRLVYSYDCDILGRNGSHQGLASFSMVREQPRKPPNVLDGYAADLTDGQKDPNKEVKVSEQVMSDAQALARARELLSTQR